MIKIKNHVELLIHQNLHIMKKMLMNLLKSIGSTIKLVIMWNLLKMQIL